MKPIRSILVLLDSRMRAGRALQRGIALARRRHARLYLGMIVHERRLEAVTASRDMTRMAQRAYVQERREWLEDCKSRAQLDPERVTTDVIWSPHPVETFLQLLRDCRPDLVLKDASCSGARLTGLLTPLDWKLLRRCPVPLMLLAPEGPPLPQRIGAAVDSASASCDPEGLNHEIVAAAQAFTADLDADTELHLASAFPASPAVAAVYPLAAETLRRAAREHAATLEALRRSAGIAAERCHRLRGETVPALEQFVEAQQLDLLVMGSHYRKGIERMLLGSTAEQLLPELRRDVLLVKPQALREALLPS